MSIPENIIDVQHLTKRFRGNTAVDDLSFSVEKGDILGFLGPNGAGKSTTLRILSGFLTPTGGRVHINGFSLKHNPMDVRRQIGYMPENVPLYSEMRVNEYLSYRADLKGLRRRRKRERLDHVLEQFSLTDVRRKGIGRLSKGYRQRVGLADALIHEPPVLLLDEPSIGLDPNQIREVRQMIRDLAGHHTVILSSHILPEIEMVSTKIMIMHRGKMVAADSTKRLKQTRHKDMILSLEVLEPDRNAVEVLLQLPGITHVDMKKRQDGWIRFGIHASTEQDPRTHIFQLCCERSWICRELRREPNTLEDIFIRLTHGGDL